MHSYNAQFKLSAVLASGLGMYFLHQRLRRLRADTSAVHVTYQQKHAVEVQDRLLPVDPLAPPGTEHGQREQPDDQAQGPLLPYAQEWPEVTSNHAATTILFPKAHCSGLHTLDCGTCREASHWIPTRKESQAAEGVKRAHWKPHPSQKRTSQTCLLICC